MWNFKLQSLFAFGALMLVVSCGGGGSGTINGSGSDGSVQRGDSVTVEGQTFRITEISDDLSSIAVSTVGSTTGGILLSIVLTRGSDGLYRYSSGSFSVIFNYEANTYSWSVLPGTSLETTVNEVLADQGYFLIPGNSREADYANGQPSQINVGLVLNNIESNLQAYAVSKDIWQNIDFSYENINVRGLQAAHSQGWTGKGAFVHIIDDFGENYSGFYFNPHPSLPDNDFTHGMISYYSIYAIAPEATIDQTEDQAYSYEGSQNYSQYDVVNWSYGPAVEAYQENSYSNYLAGLKEFSQFYYNSLGNQHPNALLVFPVGNGGEVNATTLQNAGAACGTTGAGTSTRFTASSCAGLAGALDPNYFDYLDRTIFVGAYDDDLSHLSGYSFSAGEAGMEHFMVADGNSIIDYSVGTSFAAPRLAGVAALVVQKFPNLTSAERKNLILHTGYDLGAPGVDPVYGFGLLDAEAALNPIGRLR